jgi:site-specific DNA-methyltransferase (adenine-specific)
LNELAKIESFENSLAVAETFEEIKLLNNTTEAYLQFAKKQKISDDGINQIGEFLEKVISKKGKWLEKYFPHGGNGSNQYGAKIPNENLSKMPATLKESAQARLLAETSEKVKAKIIQELKESGEYVLPKAIVKKLKQKENAKNLEKRKQENIEILAEEVKDNKPIVYKSDCVDYLNTLKDNSIDLLITDPPYSTDIKNIESFAESWVTVALTKIKKTGRAFICIGAYPKEIHAYLSVLLNQSKFIVDNPLIWTYKNTLGVTPKMKYNLNYQMILHLYSEDSDKLDTAITGEMFSVMDINAPDGRQGDRFHTWQKPDELGLRLIKHTTKENDLVVDCFAGSGSFLLMAAKMNRKAQGCDLDTIAKKRGCTIIGE